MGINEHNGIMLFAAESDSKFCQTADSEAGSCCTACFALREGHSSALGRNTIVVKYSDAWQ